jgi:hypothetical protein
MPPTVDDLIVRRAPVERHFFSIARWFGLITTALALAAAIIAALVGASKLFNLPDTKIRTPTTSYQDFRQNTEASRQSNSQTNVNRAPTQKESAAGQASVESQFEKFENQLKPYLDAVVTNLGVYATKTDQAKPSSQAIANYIRSKMQEIDRYGASDLSWKYVEGLSKAGFDIASDGDRIANLELSNPGRVRWDSFLDWYTKSYVEQVTSDLARIDAEKIRTLSMAAEAPKFLYAAAIAFSIFVLGTILLVLLRIELNTRIVD